MANRNVPSLQSRQHNYKGIILLPASMNKFGLAAVLGSSALFELHGWLPVLIFQKQQPDQKPEIPFLDEWIQNHNLCTFSVQYPDPQPEDPKDGTGGQTFLRFKRHLVAPYLDKYMQEECGIAVNRSTLVILGDGDLWPINDVPLEALKYNLDRATDPDSISLQGPVVKGFPWKRRALCYTGSTINGWYQYMNSTGDIYTDFQQHLDTGYKLRAQLDDDWVRKIPIFHKDEYNFGYKLFVEKSYPSVESDYGPRRMGKHYNETWIHNETIASQMIFRYDDLHLGRGLKPKPLMNAILRLALSSKEIETYWKIVNAAPK